MTYQEKITKAEECLQLILSGSSIEKIKSNLLDDGYFQYDIDKIMPTVKTFLEEKFSKEVDQDLLISPDFAQNRYGITNDAFIYLKEARIQNMKSGITDNLHRMVASRLSNDEILQKLKGPLYTEQELLDKIERSKKSPHDISEYGTKKEDNGKVSLIIGGVITVLFLFFGMLSLWGIGFILYGLYKYYGQESRKKTKTEIDNIGKE